MRLYIRWILDRERWATGPSRYHQERRLWGVGIRARRSSQDVLHSVRSIPAHYPTEEDETYNENEVGMDERGPQKFAFASAIFSATSATPRFVSKIPIGIFLTRPIPDRFPSFYHFLREPCHSQSSLSSRRSTWFIAVATALAQLAAAIFGRRRWSSPTSC